MRLSGLQTARSRSPDKMHSIASGEKPLALLFHLRQ